MEYCGDSLITSFSDFYKICGHVCIVLCMCILFSPSDRSIMEGVNKRIVQYVIIMFVYMICTCIK